MIEDNVLDPSFIITHRVSLDETPAAYKIFAEKKENCIKVVIKPNS
jgi:threonine dehydrogenase-like Zn-dependent dehydrogenase